MTRPKQGEKPELDELVADAFAAKQELIPTTEAEVAEAERRGVQVEGALPASLAEYRPKAAPTESDTRATDSERAPPEAVRPTRGAAPQPEVRRASRTNARCVRRGSRT